MLEKKNPKKDLERKRSTFLLIGLAIALGVCLFSINYKFYEPKSIAGFGELQVEDIDEEEITITQQERKPPPPPPPPPPPVITVVEDDVVIEEELEIQDVETDEEEIVEIIEDTDEEVDEIINFAAVEDKPVFPGCEDVPKDQRVQCFQQKMMKDIASKFEYPAMAKEMNIQERIYVEFVIGKDGKVRDARVVKGSDPDLKKEALRLVNSLPALKPAKQRGKAVRTKYTVPISFKLSN